MTYAVTKKLRNGIDYKFLTGVKYDIKDYGDFEIISCRPITDDDVIAVDGMKNGIIKAHSNGTYEFAKRTAKYYSSIGYDTHMYLMED